MLKSVCCCRRAIENKRNLLESLQKRCIAAQSKLEGEYSHLGSLEAKTKELENLRKVLCLAVMCSSNPCCTSLFPTCCAILASGVDSKPHCSPIAIMVCTDYCMSRMHDSSRFEC